jgi:hypothetical protein
MFFRNVGCLSAGYTALYVSQELFMTFMTIAKNLKVWWRERPVAIHLGDARGGKQTLRWTSEGWVSCITRLGLFLVAGFSVSGIESVGYTGTLRFRESFYQNSRICCRNCNIPKEASSNTLSTRFPSCLRDHQSGRLLLHVCLHRTVFQVVNRGLPTAAARVQSQGMCGLWLEKWLWGRFSPSSSVSSAGIAQSV